MNVKMVKLSPILKYPGGKEKELKYILPNLPESCKNYYEPFVGGVLYTYLWTAKSILLMINQQNLSTYIR